MASPNIYPSGFQLTGTVFQNGPAFLDDPAYFSGAIQWLDTISGNNANAGTDPELPVATLAQAVTNSAAQGIIVIGEGSSESLAASQALSLAGLSIYGCGAGTSRPRYTCTGAVDMLAVSGAGTWIENIYFPASTAAPTDRIGLAAANCTVVGCYFECGASDTSRSLRVHTGATQARVIDCQFLATASRPAMAIEVSAVVADPYFKNVTIDGGSYGFTDYAFKVSAAATRIRTDGVTLLRRSDFGITVTATSYTLHGITNDGSSRVFITA